MAAADDSTVGGDGATAPFIKLSACAAYANQFVAIAGSVTAVAADGSGYTVGGCLRVVPLGATDEVVVESNVLLVGVLDSTGSTLTEKRVRTMLGPDFGAWTDGVVGGGGATAVVALVGGADVGGRGVLDKLGVAWLRWMCHPHVVPFVLVWWRSPCARCGL